MFVWDEIDIQVIIVDWTCWKAQTTQLAFSALNDKMVSFSVPFTIERPLFWNKFISYNSQQTATIAMPRWQLICRSTDSMFWQFSAEQQVSYHKTRNSTFNVQRPRQDASHTSALGMRAVEQCMVYTHRDLCWTRMSCQGELPCMLLWLLNFWPSTV